MKQYTLKPEAFKAVRKKMLLRSIPLLLIALTFGFSISHFNTQDTESSTSALPLLILMVFFILGFSLWNGHKQLKQLFDSYTLTLAEDAVMREQKNTPSIRLAHAEIRDIIKNGDGSFSIMGKSIHESIGIPAHVLHPEALEKDLNQIRPVLLKKEKSLLQRLSPVLPFLTLGLMAVVYLASNKMVVGLSGMLISGLMIWSFIQIQRNKNYDHKTKRASYWTILVLVSIIGITIAKLLA